MYNFNCRKIVINNKNMKNITITYLFKVVSMLSTILRLSQVKWSLKFGNTKQPRMTVIAALNEKWLLQYSFVCLFVCTRVYTHVPYPRASSALSPSAGTQAAAPTPAGGGGARPRAPQAATLRLGSVMNLQTNFSATSRNILMKLSTLF